MSRHISNTRCKSNFGDFECMIWLESDFQALYIGTTYMVLEFIYIYIYIYHIKRALSLETIFCCAISISNYTDCVNKHSLQ